MTTKLTHIAIAAALLGAAAITGAAAQELRADAPSPELEASIGGDAVAVTGAEADEAVTRANAWLNGVSGMKGRFQQINPDGTVAEGDFYLQRPGRLRFAYDPPSPLTIVADGRTVAQIDSELETVDRTTIDQTPLNYLLKADVDLSGDANVGGVAKQDGLVLISLDDPRGQTEGQLILVFSDTEFALREWVALDAFGQETRVVLYDLTRQARLDPELFTYEFDGSSRRPGQR